MRISQKKGPLPRTEYERVKKRLFTKYIDRREPFLGGRASSKGDARSIGGHGGKEKSPYQFQPNPFGKIQGGVIDQLAEMTGITGQTDGLL